ncbi:kinesin-like protein KIN-14P isoform X2 [Olea europaea var. sylvestris]|uniref:kinesin-like protein KIN-14P isoform X2 n=1 Tax=Olea europaea var. sylvestris TaxID=158386 RepID=UPI000C1D6F67|nr:kinesin-like protein KIN-14P isoform X2 [Olea europaea var. sylvestris]
MNMQSEAHATKKGEPGSNFSDVFQSKHGYHGDFLASKISELMKLESLESATSRSLFSAVTSILEESIEKKNESIPQRVASVVKLIVQEIEQRVYKQAENMRKQKNLYKSREDRYQLKIRALETLATGTIEENEIAMKQLQQIKVCVCI